jgi:hypothetical protein
VGLVSYVSCRGDLSNKYIISNNYISNIEENMSKIDWKMVDTTSLASQLVYMKGSKGEVKHKQIINWKNFPEALMFNIDDAQGFVARLDDTTVIISFRGTEPRIASDIIADLKTWQVDSETIGDVHSGFKQELDKLYPDVSKWVFGKNVSKKRDTIILTGHSLGAAMASICATRLNTEGYRVKLYTYGSPRVGDSDWATLFESDLDSELDHKCHACGQDTNKIEHYRFHNNQDLIPAIPPLGTFTHVGKLYYVNYTGEILTNTTFISRLIDRFKSMFRAIRKLERFDSMYDHNIKQYRRRVCKHV